MSANATPVPGAQPAVSHAPQHWVTNASHTIAIGSLCTGYTDLGMGVAAALGGVRLAWFTDTDPDMAHLLAGQMGGEA